MKLKHVDKLEGGGKRFRRRWPKAFAHLFEKEFFTFPMRAREGAALVAEQEKLLAEYDKLVAKARRKAAGQGQLSPLEHWREATAEAEAMVAAIKGGLDEDDRRDVLAEDLHKRGADPVLLKAVTQPEAEAPPVTLQDAKRMYFKERIEGEKGRNKRDQLERVCGRVEKALGPLGKLPLVNLKREHARRLRDFLLNETKADGNPSVVVGAFEEESFNKAGRPDQCLLQAVHRCAIYRSRSSSNLRERCILPVECHRVHSARSPE